MLCVVIGIVPPLDDSTRTKLFQNVKEIQECESAEKTRIVWAQDTVQEAWVIPDEDADDVPTMLLSAYLINSDNENAETTIFGNGNSNVCVTPEEFLSVVQAEIHRSSDRFACEVWASAPAPLPLLKIGGQSLQKSTFASEFCEKGLCRLPNVLISGDETDTTTLSRIRSMVDGAITKAEEAIATNHPNTQVGEDAFWFREIASRSKHRFDLLIGNDTDLYQLVWNQVLGNDSEIPSLLQTLFHDDHTEWEMDLSVVYSKPGANHQGWHADGGHIEGDSDTSWDESSSRQTVVAAPYAICLFVPLIDLDHTVGYTQFWPGTHKYKELVGFGPFAEVAKATWDGKVRAGEAIAYDYRLLHRGMPNYSNTKSKAYHPYRAVLQLLCRKHWYKEKNNYGKASIYQPALQ